MNNYGFAPYVPVSTQQANARRAMEKLRKKGMTIRPIEIKKRKITQKFWGNAWCQHIESFSDYENRLPRGRRYVRNGSVCHLEIHTGCIDAMVSGSSLYKVHIKVNPLSDKRWEDIKKACLGKILSLVDLLMGHLSDEVMELVCHPQFGLFPQPKDIQLACSCPDWAMMCKHIAAVLYGVGARFDHAPEKLFDLRGVKHNELIDATTFTIDAVQDSHGRRIQESAISNIFDIELSKTNPSENDQNFLSTQKVMKSRKISPKKKKTSLRFRPRYFSGVSIYKKRKQLGCTQKIFAQYVGVSASTISRWEQQGRYKLNLSSEMDKKLRQIWKKLL